MNGSVIGFVALALAAGSVVQAHDGRRFEVVVHEGRLAAQGYISNGVDDGGGVVRPYFNAIHGHWTNNPSPAINAASGDLPGFDVFAGSELIGFGLDIELIGALKWEDVPPMPVDGTVPDLVALTTDEVFVTFGGETVSTSAPGAFTLVDSVSSGGALDIDLSYDIADRPSGELYVLQFVLSTGAPGIADSGVVNVILSPDGTGPMERLHHASLYLENFLGTPVPSPGVTAVGVALFGFATPRRRP